MLMMKETRLDPCRNDQSYAGPLMGNNTDAIVQQSSIYYVHPKTRMSSYHRLYTTMVLSSLNSRWNVN